MPSYFKNCLPRTAKINNKFEFSNESTVDSQREEVVLHNDFRLLFDLRSMWDKSQLKI